MRVLFACDKFAGTMSAVEASEAMSAGWLEARPKDEVSCVPMADGGPGSIDVVARARGGVRRISPSIDQLGRPVEAEWLELPNGVALLESAQTCGIHLVAPERRNPLKGTSRGLGLLLREVVQRGFETVMIGMGGTGTVDGGLGAVAELGAEILDQYGQPLSTLLPSDYELIDRVGPLVDPVCRIISLVDVTNPLLGVEGAARLFGPQKGAAPADIDVLERSLAHLADVVERSLPGGPWRNRPGAGAAGGLTLALMAWAGSTVESGAAAIGAMVGLHKHIEWADVVVTGEGRIDHQTKAGKVPSYIAESARTAGKRVFAIAGQADPTALADFDRVELLGQGGLTEPIATTEKAAYDLAVSMR